MPENVIQLPPPPADQPEKKKRRRAKAGWQRWPGVRGGRIHVAQNGALSFYVDRVIRGKRYASVNLHATDPESAVVKLRNWEKNPDGFNPCGVAPVQPVYLTEELVTAYVRWCEAVPPGKVRRRNTDKTWVSKKRNYLAWWSGQLAGTNLRADRSPGSITTDLLVDKLATATDYRHRLEAIKALYGYLQVEARGPQRIAPEHDPARVIPVPMPDAAQVKPGGSKVEWSKDDCDKVIEWLERHNIQRRRVVGKDATFTVEDAAAYLGLTVGTVRAFAERGRLNHQGGGHGYPLTFTRRDLDAYDRQRAAAASTPRRVALALRILGGTAWHVTEVVRFSKNGVIDELPPDHIKQNGAVKLLACLHKMGFAKASAVTRQVADAAAELQRLGGIDVNSVFKWTRKAVEATGVAPFQPGRFRHRQSTYQVNQGVAVKEVQEQLGHSTPETTRIYTALAVPPKGPTWY